MSKTPRDYSPGGGMNLRNNFYTQEETPNKHSNEIPSGKGSAGSKAIHISQCKNEMCPLKEILKK